MAIDWNGWVYQTNDRGRSWKKIAELGRSHEEIGIDPNDDKSFEKGWYLEQQGTRHSELAVDPADDNTWYVVAGDFWNVKANHKSAVMLNGNRFLYADYGHIWKTSDQGKSWKKISDGLPADLDVAKIIVNPESGNKLVMATSHGLMRSVDGGGSWTDITGNLAFDLNAIDYPAEKERFHRALAYWFGISTAESKAKFTRLSGQALPVFNRIAVNPLNKDEIYVSYNKKHDFTFGPGDVWRTLDGGKTWAVVARHGAYWNGNKDNDYWKSRGNPTGANIRFAHLQHYMDAQAEVSGNRMLAVNSIVKVFIGIDQQTLKSTDRGESWQQVDDDETAEGSNKWIGRGDSNLPGRFMLLETGMPGRKLLTSGEHGLWQTTGLDGWPDKEAIAVEQIEGQNHPDGAHSISTVAVHPDNPDVIYISPQLSKGGYGFYHSSDGGYSWQLANDGFHEGASVRRIAMDPDNPEVFYAALNDDNGGLFRTDDKGDHWQRLEIPPVIKAVNNVFIDRNNRSIYISAGRNDGTYEEGGVWRSADGGGCWLQIFKAPLVWQAESSPVNPELIVIRVAGQKVSMAGRFRNPGIYLSLDGGKSSKKINQNLGQPDQIVDVKPDPDNEKLLWSASWGSGWSVGYLK